MKAAMKKKRKIIDKNKLFLMVMIQIITKKITKKIQTVKTIQLLKIIVTKKKTITIKKTMLIIIQKVVHQNIVFQEKFGQIQIEMEYQKMEKQEFQEYKFNYKKMM